MNFMQDPWYIGMLITLVASLIIVAWAARPVYRDLLILALAFPQALFKKVFGDPPPADDDGH